MEGYLASAEENEEIAKISFQELNDIFSEGSPDEQEENVSSEPTQNTEVDKKKSASNGNHSALGILKINKIDLKLPILEGASQNNLRYAAGHVSGTGVLGKEGNAGIAAHRSFKYGKLFNRLNELEKEDQVVVETPEGKLYYKVTQKFLVLPEDVSVLNPQKNTSMITLITCHPMKNPTHRLIVQAELQTNK